jgi:hypothetical protein
MVVVVAVVVGIGVTVVVEFVVSLVFLPLFPVFSSNDVMVKFFMLSRNAWTSP